MHGLGAFEESRWSSPGAIDQLVRYDQVPWFVFLDEAPGGGGADDPVDSDLPQRPEVGAIRNYVGWKLVVATVTGEKRHLDPVNGTQRQRGRRIPKGRSDGQFAGVLEKLIETRTPDDTDHESPLDPPDLDPPDLESLDLESLDFESLDLELLDFESLDLELLDRELLDVDLLDLESVT